MNETLNNLDALIAQKREELKNLLLARDVLSTVANGEGAAIPVDVAPLLALASGDSQDTSPKEQPQRRKKTDKAARKDRIKAAAQKKKKGPGRAKPGKRRTFSREFKLQVLREVDEADMLKEVLERHNLYPSHIATWTRQKEEGKLDPSPGAAAAPAAAPEPEEADDDELDYDEFDEESEDLEVEEEPDEEEMGDDDLIAVLGPKEAPPVIPFDQSNPEDTETVQPKTDLASLS